MIRDYTIHIVYGLWLHQYMQFMTCGHVNTYRTEGKGSTPLYREDGVYVHSSLTTSVIFRNVLSTSPIDSGGTSAGDP